MPVLNPLCAVGLSLALKCAGLYLAEEVRARLLRQTNNPQLVQRLAPMQPGEAQAAQRARSLYTSLMHSMGRDTPPLLQVAHHSFSSKLLSALVTSLCLLHCPCYGKLTLWHMS